MPHYPVFMQTVVSLLVLVTSEPIMRIKPRELSPGEVLSYDVRRQCEMGHLFKTKTECEQQLQYWVGSLAPIDGGDNCVVDPTTKEMECARQTTCQGGHPYRHDVNVMVYPCGSQCEGSLLIDCCQTCDQYKRSPRQLGVGEVSCEGCEIHKLTAAANSADCTFDGRRFDCHIHNECNVGSPHYRNAKCLIYPCDNCDHDSVLKQKCCQECLQLLCDHGGQTRLVCQGCEGGAQYNIQTTNSNSSGGLVWLVLLSLLLLCCCLCACYVSQSQKRNREITLEDGESN